MLLVENQLRPITGWIMEKAYHNVDFSACVLCSRLLKGSVDSREGWQIQGRIKLLCLRVFCLDEPSVSESGVLSYGVRMHLSPQVQGYLLRTLGYTPVCVISSFWVELFGITQNPGMEDGSLTMLSQPSSASFPKVRAGSWIRSRVVRT